MAQWIGPHRILALLGRGGIAEVWLAADPSGRQVALKRLHRATPRDVARLRREGDWLSEIEHPNVVRALGSGAHEGVPFLLLEWAAGGSLESRARPVPTAALARWAIDVLAGLGALHAHGVVHRDVKPANLLLGSDGAMRVADLGVGWGPGAVRSRPGATLGSPAYMAPEQRYHPDHVGPAADL
ncbi:MAG: serine/threonine-protein kinase, partial [Myxococcota bacterium]